MMISSNCPIYLIVRRRKTRAGRLIDMMIEGKFLFSIIWSYVADFLFVEEKRHI